MVWQPEIEELEHRKRLAMRMGGEERIARQHSERKLTVRERVDTLLDPGTFFEIGELAGYGEYDEDRTLTGFTPSALRDRTRQSERPARRGRPASRALRRRAGPRPGTAPEASAPAARSLDPSILRSGRSRLGSGYR